VYGAIRESPVEVGTELIGEGMSLLINNDSQGDS